MIKSFVLLTVAAAVLVFASVCAVADALPMGADKPPVSSNPIDEQVKAEYRQAYERLEKQYSLERVARERIEVGFDDLAGMATPLSLRVPIQPMHHNNEMLVLPDMALSMGTTPESYNIGFAVGSPAELPDMWKVQRKLHKGYQPIVTSSYRTGDVAIEQTAFGMLPYDRKVVTGGEVQYVVVHYKITNTSASRKDVPFLVLVGRMGGRPAFFYDPYAADPTRFQTEQLDLQMKDGALFKGDKVVFAYRVSRPTQARFVPAFDNKGDGGRKPKQLNNCLVFDLNLGAGETRSIDLVVSGSAGLYPASEAKKMKEVDFQPALKFASNAWDEALKPAMVLCTPEQRVNNIYKAMILSNLGLMLKRPDWPGYFPAHSSGVGVVAWEFAFSAVPMAAVGYQEEVGESLIYFLRNQEANGSYGGSAGPWVSHTGAVMWLMADNYLYSRDAEWFKSVHDSLVAAGNWVEKERSSTMTLDQQGNRFPYYGLMPAGNADDSPETMYSFTMSDNFVWYGLSQVAKAFRDAGFPEAKRFTKDAEGYRRCILDVVRREKCVDPKSNLQFIPNAVGGKLGHPLWMANGPVQMYFTGLLRPTDDYYPQMVEYTQRNYGTLLGMAEHFSGGMQWYPNQTEVTYFKCYLARGETEKALLVLYSNLAYGMSNDTYQTVERFNADDPNYAPFQPNGSGNGRNIDMIRRMVIDEQDAGVGRLWLMRGCPRRWFSKGKSITVENAPTLFGKMALKMKSYGDKITVDVDSPTSESPKDIRVILRHPQRKTIVKATANGQDAEVDGESVVLHNPKGHIRVICEY